MKVDFYSTADIPDSIKADYFKTMRSVIDSDSLIEGKTCRSFEEEFSLYLNVKNVLGVGNGFDAIKIGLQAIGVKPGDKVAVPAHTFIATWYAIQIIGAIPVGIDVDEFGQIDLDLLELETGLKCVIPVHMHGTHCDMVRLSNWARRNKVLVLEDCAQAAGLNIQGRKAGTWGDLAAFSFYPTKNLFALGDGGVIVTNNDDYFEEARLHSRYGSKKDNKYIHIKTGQNSRLDSIQAAVLLINLRYLDEWNDTRVDIAKLYNRLIANNKTLKSSEQSHIYHHYVILNKKRQKLQNYLMQNQIKTEIHYPNLAAYEADRNSKVRFMCAEKISEQTLSLPISPWQTSQKTEYVASKVSEYLGE